MKSLFGSFQLLRIMLEGFRNFHRIRFFYNTSTTRNQHKIKNTVGSPVKPSIFPTYCEFKQISNLWSSHLIRTFSCNLYFLFSRPCRACFLHSASALGRNNTRGARLHGCCFSAEHWGSQKTTFLLDEQTWFCFQVSCAVHAVLDRKHFSGINSPRTSP